MSSMPDLQRTAQRLEMSVVKTVHLRDYENEEYSCSMTATYNRTMTPEESAVEISKLQAELEYAIYRTLYQRKLITTHDYNVRVGSIKNDLKALGVSEENLNYMKGGL